MSRVFAGGVSQEGLALISSYLNKYMPDAEIEQLPVAGIKGRIKNQGKRPDVALIILDSSLYQQCVGVADDVLSLPKVLKYEDDESLRQFLIEKFGVVDAGNGKAESASGISESSPADVEEIKKLNALIQSKEATITNLRNRIRELSLDNEDLNTYIDKIAFLEKQVSELSNGVDSKGTGKKGNLGIEISSLEARNKNLQAELDATRVDYNSLKAKYDDLASTSGDSEKLEIEMNSLKTKITSLEDDLHESEVAKQALQEQITQLEGIKQELSKKCSLLENSEGISADLKAKLEELKATLASKDEENTGLKAELDSTKEELKATKDALTSSENVVKTLTDEVAKASASSVESAEMSVELSKAKDSVNSLTSSLELAKTELQIKKEECEEHLREIADLKSEVESRDEQIADLNKGILSSTSEVTALTEQLKSLNEISTKYSEVKDSLRASESEVEELKKNNSLLELDKKNLTERVSELEGSAISITEVAKLRRKCEEQEGDLNEMRDFLSDIKTSPFFLMNNYALPKVAMQLALDVELHFKKSKFVLVSTGSGESAPAMYTILKERCEASKKTFLIVDLVTESFIDSSVGLVASLPAHSWLSGGDVTPCISDTKLKNVTAVTTGIGYMNDLFFLSVDWTSRLQLLDGLADVVIFNIGCLDSAVRVALFNSMIDVCDASNIFVRATPTNMRTTINHLSGIVNLGISKVVCSDFVSNGNDASQKLFDKLSSKCDTEVYAPTIDLGW